MDLQSIVLAVIGMLFTWFCSKYYFLHSYKNKQHMLNAVWMFIQGDEVAFLAELDKIDAKDSPIGAYMKGITNYNKGRFQEAILEFDNVLKKQEDNWQANFHLGLIYNNLEMPRCYRYYEAALRKNDKNFSLHFNYALAVHNSILASRGDDDKKEAVILLAIYHYLKSLVMIPYHPGLKKNLLAAIRASKSLRDKSRSLAAKIGNTHTPETAKEIRNIIFRNLTVRPYTELETTEDYNLLTS